jgi:hypothetical protein
MGIWTTVSSGQYRKGSPITRRHLTERASAIASFWRKVVTASGPHARSDKGERTDRGSHTGLPDRPVSPPGEGTNRELANSSILFAMSPIGNLPNNTLDPDKSDEDKSAGGPAGGASPAPQTPESETALPTDGSLLSAAERIFHEHLEADNVELSDLVRAKVYQSAHLTPDAQTRAVGERYYPSLEASFLRSHTGTSLVIQPDAGMAVSLGPADGDEIDQIVISKTINFDWTVGRNLLLDLAELTTDVCRWLPDRDERRSLLDQLFALTSQVHAAIGNENARHPRVEVQPTPPTEWLTKDIEVINPRLEKARRRFLQDAQRAAQTTYATGMARGVLVLGVLCLALGGVLALAGVRAVYGVGFAAGGIGACISVLQRMTSGSLELNFQAAGKMLTLFGALRPLVGGMFGIVTFCILKADLISFLILPDRIGQQLAFVAAFAFLAGFNERFFQDMLASASQGLGTDR